MLRLNWLPKLRYGFYVLLAWLAAHTLFITIAGLHDSPQPADVVVILGNKVNEDGTLSERLTQRLHCGLRLYRQGRVKRLLVSGGRGKEGFWEGDKMRDFLRAQGVPDSVILVDNQGNTTRQTVRTTLRLQRQLHFRSVLVVSQYYHISRTKMLFRQAGFPAAGGVSPRYFEWRDAYSLLREFGAFYWEALAE